MTFDPSIYKAYDIRGIYPDQLDESIANKTAQAFTLLLKKETSKANPSIVISMDMRLSSPSLRDAVIQGCISQGAHVISIGLASTPTFYFSVGYLQADGGIQMSASHNPAKYNGMKIVRAKGVPVSGDSGIYTLRDTVAADTFTPSDVIGNQEDREDMVSILVEKQADGINLNKIKPFTVVVDPANAMGILDIQAISPKLSLHIIPLNFNLDGTFPAHEADPLKPENTVQCAQAVRDNHADFGILIDGDGDRVFIVMDNGEMLPPEILRGILAQIVLKEHPGAHIGYDIRPGRITRDLILKAGGQPFITRVGHSLIKEKMLEYDSPFSGESSGHFFYKSKYGTFEMPIKMLLEFMTWLSSFDIPLSEIVKPYQKYVHSGEINTIVEDKESVFSKLKAVYGDAKEFSDLDGVYFEYEDFWFNVRASNTEPKMRLNLEAIDRKTMETKRDEVLALIRDASPTA